MPSMTRQDEQSTASLAAEAVANDISESNMYPAAHAQPSSSPQQLSEHSLAGRYRRPSHNAPGPRPMLGMQPPETIVPLEQDREAAISEERELLEDNELIPKRSRRQSEGGWSRKSVTASFANRAKKVQRDEETADGGNEAGETTALLGSSNGGRDTTASPTPEDVDAKWEEAVLAGKIQTTWQREAKTIGKYSLPLMATFLLQQSLTLVSVFTVGHINKEALGAVALGSMTASITGYSVYYGLATSLDTLCAQAYGSGKKELVGLYLQRMVFFIYVCTVPIAVAWFFGGAILSFIIPEKEIAMLAGQYLRILIIGAPGFATFECAKRYVQAQGLFNASLYVLLFAAPLNAFLHWLFVWHFQWGFIGCPIAVVIVENLMVVLLFLYVRLNPSAMECWPGFSRAAFRNWGPMIRLALPGLAMILAEFLAFEILTLSASWIDATTLGAQSILQQLSVQTYALPFPISIASSTRVANFIGAGLPDAAKITTRVTFVLGATVGVINMVLVSSLRFKIPPLFTNDAEVIALAASVLPINAAFQLFDALAAQCNGVLRGLGKQEAGGYISMIAYYLVAIPLALGTAFGAHLGIYGLWLGPFAGLGLAASVEGVYIWRTSWEQAAEEARKRNEDG
ncbi:MATE efflux family protein [Polychaeton citri CBS 116435]|uniref:MATE efflux family protein n=1 Tax=Polychaeton citri CBS 116435 TaxID=1314669 RepID=A0A9P4Q0Z6_9PEZI|nr:MATE efflux family protein [Polychaeton citri CBS 116435]